MCSLKSQEMLQAFLPQTASRSDRQPLRTDASLPGPRTSFGTLLSPPSFPPFLPPYFMAVRGTEVPAPSYCQEWFLTFFGSGPTENYGPSQDGIRGWGKHSLETLRNFQTKDLKHTPNCKIKNPVAKTLDPG